MDTNTKKQVQQNADDIQEIKGSINTIMTNHLYHIEKDMSNMDKRIEKMDARIWWVLGLLVVGIVIPAFINGLMGG